MVAIVHRTLRGSGPWDLGDQRPSPAKVFTCQDYESLVELWVLGFTGFRV